jgi:hypothetical protein
MYKLLKSSYFWLIYAIGLTLFSFSLFFQWGLMVGTLFAIFFCFRLTRLETTLSDREHRFYLLAILLYPPAETTVQWLQIRGLMPHDFALTNRLEHFCWAIALTLFFLPLIAGIWKRLNRWQNLIFVAGFVCLLGNLNEFLEYLLRIKDAPVDYVLFSRYYSDTILDMTMNLLGSLVSFALLNRVFVKAD